MAAKFHLPKCSRRTNQCGWRAGKHPFIPKNRITADLSLDHLPVSALVHISGAFNPRHFFPQVFKSSDPSFPAFFRISKSWTADLGFSRSLCVYIIRSENTSFFPGPVLAPTLPLVLAPTLPLVLAPTLPFGPRPYSAFGPRPYSALGPSPYSAFGPRPYSALGPRPYSALGPRPYSALGPRFILYRVPVHI